jgi:hypothetical protein
MTWSCCGALPARFFLLVLAATAPSDVKGAALFLPPLRTRQTLLEKAGPDQSSSPTLAFSEHLAENSTQDGTDKPWQAPSFLEYSSSTEDDSNNPRGDDFCDVTSFGSLCFSDRQGVLEAAGKPPGLVGRWTFDEEFALDSSGHSNHGNMPLLHGPSPAGIGHSALFRKSFVTLPHTEQLDFQFTDFAFTFWIYVPTSDLSIKKIAPNWCPVLRKGVHAPNADHFESSPAILYSQATGHLRLGVSTTTHSGTDAPDGQYIDSNARVRPNRWMHLAVQRHGPKMLLYANGILDAVMPIHGEILHNKHALYVGGDPFSTEQCAHTMYLDELRIYNRALAPHELEAQAALALGGVSPSFVHLGCPRCGAMEAKKSCPQSRHICSNMELHAGAYQVARTQGWITKGLEVWTHDRLAGKEFFPNPDVLAMSVGLALCCEGPLPA